MSLFHRLKLKGASKNRSLSQVLQVSTVASLQIPRSQMIMPYELRTSSEGKVAEVGFETPRFFGGMFFDLFIQVLEGF